MTAVTFDSVPLKNPAPLAITRDDDEIFQITFDCFTDDYGDIEDIQAECGRARAVKIWAGVKIQTTGTKGALVISGVNADIDDTYNNCVIMEPIKVEEVEGTGGKVWRYRVVIAQETV